MRTHGEGAAQPALASPHTYHSSQDTQTPQSTPSTSSCCRGSINCTPGPPQTTQRDIPVHPTWAQRVTQRYPRVPPHPNQAQGVTRGHPRVPPRCTHFPALQGGGQQGGAQRGSCHHPSQSTGGGSSSSWAAAHSEGRRRICMCKVQREIKQFPRYICTARPQLLLIRSSLCPDNVQRAFVWRSVYLNGLGANIFF